MTPKPEASVPVAPAQETRNSKVLANFVAYCQAHPEQRFWQALRNWSGYSFLFASRGSGFDNGIRKDFYDTFYWEGKRHDG